MKLRHFHPGALIMHVCPNATWTFLGFVYNEISGLPHMWGFRQVYFIGEHKVKSPCGDNPDRIICISSMSRFSVQIYFISIMLLCNCLDFSLVIASVVNLVWLDINT